MDRKVLIITYYWPPSGGGGVQRWLKFVKYLVSFGWKPTVFTPQNPSFPTQDPSLAKDIPPSVEVLEFPIWEPHHLFHKINHKLGHTPVKQGDIVAAGKKSKWLQLSAWVRGNLFIPDSRVYWVKPSVTFLKNYLIDNDIHTVITTGPPHSVHLIGLKLKQRIGRLRWVADFRDPWSTWGINKALKLSPPVMKRHRKMEKEVLQQADVVMATTPGTGAELQQLGAKKICVITNGFDEDDFKTNAPAPAVRSTTFTVRYIGVLETRDPRPFMQAVVDACEANPDMRDALRINFVGNTNQSFKDHVAGDQRLSAITTFTPQVPHEEALTLYLSADLLLVVLTNEEGKQVIPGKIFEYMAAGRPVLGIGHPGGDCAHVLRQTKTGTMVHGDDIGAIRDALTEHYNQWKAGKPHQSGDIAAYSRQNLTRQLIDVLESL